MRRILAEFLNMLGSRAIDIGKPNLGKSMYRFAASVDPRWSVPWYNLGLQAKYEGRWEESQRFNQRAVELNPSDEAAWWNLGIAATALKNWSEARRAWKACGTELIEGGEDVRMPPVTGCVRLDPNGRGEVVWGERLDPARIVVLNVPLPESSRRFRDIILNDGATNGKRTDSCGNEISVFDELCIWKVSPYSTFRAHLRIPDETAEKHLIELCNAHEFGVEDWSTMRFICAECSRGTPGPHRCEAKPLQDGTRRFGFGAKSQQELLAVLREWSSANASADVGELELVLSVTRS